MRTRRWLVPAAWGATLIIAAAAGVWATRATLESPIGAEPTVRPSLYTVRQGTVSRIVSFVAEARWETVPLAINAASGTVTTVEVAAGSAVDTGQMLYSVDLRPTVAAVGSVPAFRDISLGLRGADIEQLQRFLAESGHYEGALDGIFDPATVAAVEAWQGQLGVEPDGIVRRSDVLFVPELPTRIAPSAELRVGLQLSGGEPVIERLPEAPAFTITLGADQADLVPLTASVVVHHSAGVWDGSIASSTTRPTGELVLALEGVDGTPLCGAACDAVPVGEPVLYATDLVAVPETTGPLVPVSALRTSPDGAVTIVTEQGVETPVEIVAAAEGRAVVSGIDEGTRVYLFGDGPAAGPSPSSEPS